MPDAAVRANLRKALVTLRKEIGSALTFDRRYVALNTETSTTVDVSAFRRLMESGLQHKRYDEIASALTLYRGEFLPGFHVRNGQDFERWVWAEQEQLRQFTIDGLHVLIDRELETSTFEDTIHHAQHLLSIESWTAWRSATQYLINGSPRRTRRCVNTTPIIPIRIRITRKKESIINAFTQPSHNSPILLVNDVSTFRIRLCIPILEDVLHIRLIHKINYPQARGVRRGTLWVLLPALPCATRNRDYKQ
ncbi:MAG: bacterial transcriptional activator domain-containing protein [Chloroflexota bacterium]